MKSTLPLDQDNRIYELLQQNESIFSKVKEKARFINQTNQKLEDNLKHIRTPIETKTQDSIQDKENCYTEVDYSFSRHHPNEAKYEVMGEISFRHPEQKQFETLQPILVQPQQHSESKSSSGSSYSSPCYSVTFIPFNKLYRSPIIQLKSKDKVILARRYKGSSIASNQGKITDGKIYRLNKIITDQEELLSGLCDPSNETEVIGLVGAKSTLKKKLQMCLLIKQYQNLRNMIIHAQMCKVQIHYSEIWDKVLQVNEEQKLDINTQSKHSQLLRMSTIFEHLLSLIKGNKGPKPYKHKTRISRIIFASDNTRHLLQLISTSNQSLDFLRELRVRTLVWCINPLVKNYQNSQNTLEAATHFQR